MHDPDVVAFEIRRPWPQRSSVQRGPRWKIGKSPFWSIAGKHIYWPSLITVWHHEPGGKDSGDVCDHWKRDADGKVVRASRAWRWHVHHWRLQVPPLQDLRRWALTRCEWCGGRSSRRDVVNCSHGWDRERGPWWRGERGLYHRDCSTMQSAYSACLCLQPEIGRSDHGRCARCGLFRAWRQKLDWMQRMAFLRANVRPAQKPTAEVMDRLHAMVAEAKAAALPEVTHG